MSKGGGCVNGQNPRDCMRIALMYERRPELNCSSVIRPRKISTLVEGITALKSYWLVFDLSFLLPVPSAKSFSECLRGPNCFILWMNSCIVMRTLLTRNSLGVTYTILKLIFWGGRGRASDT